MRPAPIRTIAGGRELRKYSNGYWYIRLTSNELLDYPGTSWTGYVTFHKWKLWKEYGEHYWHYEARYYYRDGNPDNIRLTNIDIRFP